MVKFNYRVHFMFVISPQNVQTLCWKFAQWWHGAVVRYCIIYNINQCPCSRGLLCLYIQWKLLPIIPILYSGRTHRSASMYVHRMWQSDNGSVHFTSLTGP